MKRIVCAVTLAALASPLGVAAATPPEAINYQGVLRDSADRPLDGTYPMTFRFFDQSAGGLEILVDTHPAVVVSGGLFNVQLGTGTVIDGAGPGIYTTLSRAVAEHADLHLEVEVGGEILSPRVPIVATAHALNARRVRGLELVGEGPLDLYVSASSGDDANDGLAPDRPKRTIQAALGAVPLVIGGPVTVRVADGTYTESLGIGERVRRGPFPIRLEGNVAFPQNVLLDGQGLLDQGMMIGDPGVEIAGFRIANFNEQALSFNNTGGAVVERCEIVDNNSDIWDGAVELEDGSWCDMFDSLVANNAGGGISVAANSHFELIETTVSGNLGFGVEVVRGSDLLLKNATISGNGSAGIYTRLSEVHAYPDDGGTQITGNAFGVYAGANSLIDFYGQPGIVIQANPGGDMVAQSHSTIRGYGNGTVGACVTADGHSMCNP